MTRKLLVVLFFGAVLSAGAGVVFPTASTWKYFKGFSEASSPDPSAWREIGFDDSSWASGQAAFYFENQPGSAGAYTGNTLLDDMFGGYTCIFLRKTFVVTNVGDFSELQLHSFSDDGFIAWINGTEVARFNMPGGAVPFDGSSSPALAEPIQPQDDALANPAAYLVPGTNVIAVQAFNSSLASSSDFVIDLSLDYTKDTTPPTLAALIPASGATVRSLTVIEVDFSEDVAGVDASDLLINGNPAASVTAFAPWQYVFQFPQPAPGTIRIAWAGNHGIHDLAGTPNNFAGGSWTNTLNPNVPLPGVMISEFMADNKDTLHDEDGESSDWIEIFNPTSSSVNLAGWALTDDTRHLQEWRFPNVTLAAKDYLLVFASGKDRTNVTRPLHTNFRLSDRGGFLALVDPQTNIVSSFAPVYPTQQKDVSYGRDGSSPDVVGYFTTPTPGAPNSTVGAGFSSKVEFSQNGGTFTTPFALELWTASTSAVIRFTLDGSAPTESSAAYAGPINISSSVQVRARSFEPGLLPGPLHSETFMLLTASAINFTSDLPVIIIHTLGGGAVTATASKFANMSFYEPQNGKTSLTNAPTLSTRAALRVRGSSTVFLAKQSWAVEFWDDFDNDKKASPLGLPEESDWILYAPNGFEPVLIHNPFIFDLSNQIGRYASRARFVEVFLSTTTTTAGPISTANYNGIYVLEEKIKVGKDRVDVDKLHAENVNPPEVTGGYAMKIDRLDPGDGGFFGAGLSIAYVDPKEEEITLPQRAPQQQYLQEYMDSFGNALFSSDPLTGYPAYVDVDSWIDHHILNVMAFNVDALRLSAYFYKERNGKLFFGPIWDFDRALGSTDGRDSNPRVWRSQSGDRGTDFFNYPWWGELFNDIDFWQKWIDRWQDLRLGQFSLTNMNALVDSMANTVRKEQPREQARWGVAPRGGSYQAEVNLMKSWLANRVNFIDTNFLAKPVFNYGTIVPGFPLAIAGPAGATIYYTLDGSDPRLSGGDLSPTARVYSGPIILNTNTRVAARARNLNHSNLTGPDNPPLSSPWSGLTAATFVIATPPLVVTEIMYHPAPPPPGSTNSAEDFEYLELKNVGASTLNLIGVRFTNGVDYAFTVNGGVTNLAAGGTVLVVKNRSAFLSRYPAVANIAGEYIGNLDNSGERLTLVGSALEPILDFHYENSWHPITDGPGFSLVIVNPNAPMNTWSNQTSWRPSVNANGSPGVADPAPRVFPPVLINEALTHTDLPQLDAIELYNAGTNTADISGWFLSDDFSQPKKYRFPGVTIPAGGFLTVNENNFNNGSPTSFSFSSLGDEVWLFSGDAATNLTGYFHGFRFDAAQNGVTFGRHVTSDGAEHFVAQVANTLGTNNAGPAVGPIVINEIMYQPSPVVGTNNNTLDEYIELRNITAQATPLYDPNFPTNTWKLSGGADYVFPRDLKLPPDGYLLLVNFDPVHQPAQLAAFQAKYGLSSGTKVVGPYGGSLDNTGERLKLLKPDPPQTAPSPNPGFVPYVLVDQVTYAATAPWPTNANGTGLCLQRIDSASYGDDPIHWLAASPTAGSANPGSGTLDRDGDGLPDAWELANGLDAGSAIGDDGASGDPDGDGLTNTQEYVSGTRPRDPSSYLKIESLSAASATTRLHFNAVAGKTYSILYRDNIDSGLWIGLTNVPAQPSSGEFEVADPGASETRSRFYRLVTPSRP